MELRLAARRDLGHARHGEVMRASRELAERNSWWCGAPCIWVDKKLVGTFEFRYDDGTPNDEAFGAHDLAIVIRWLRTIETSWDITLPDGTIATIGDNVPLFAGSALDPLLAAAAIDPHFPVDRYGDLGQHAFVWTSRSMGERAQYIANLRAGIELEPELPELAAELAAIGQSGLAGVWRWNGPPSTRMTMVADRAANALRLGVIGTNWVELEYDRARMLFATACEFDLAYHCRRRDQPRATLVDDFLDPDGVVFTNGTWNDRFGGGSTPIGSATFDLAFVSVGVDRVGLVWIGDED